MHRCRNAPGSDRATTMRTSTCRRTSSLSTRTTPTPVATKARCAQFGILRAFAPTAGAEPICNLVPVRICTVQRERIAHWLPALQRKLDRKRLYAHTPIEQIEGWIGVENLFDSVIVFDRP